MTKVVGLPEGSPYVGLMKENKVFLRWYLNVRRGSDNTASGYLRRMGNVCAERGIRPRDLAKLSPVELNTFVGGLISAREEAGQRGSAIGTYVRALIPRDENSALLIKRLGTLSSPAPDRGSSPAEQGPLPSLREWVSQGVEAGSQRP